MVYNPYAKNNKRPRPVSATYCSQSNLNDAKKPAIGSITSSNANVNALATSSIVNTLPTAKTPAVPVSVVNKNENLPVKPLSAVPIQAAVLPNNQPKSAIPVKSKNPYLPSSLPADSWMRQVGIFDQAVVKENPHRNTASASEQQQASNVSVAHHPTTFPSNTQTTKPALSAATNNNGPSKQTAHGIAHSHAHRSTTLPNKTTTQTTQATSISNLYPGQQVSKAVVKHQDVALARTAPPSASTRGLAALRPESWNTTNHQAQQKPPAATIPKTTVAPPTTISTKPSVELPGEPCLPRMISFSPADVKPVNDEYRMNLIKNAQMGEKLNNGWELKKHQKQALTKSLSMRRCILALDMGLGKTLIGCVYAKAFKATFRRLKVFVMCPVSMEAEWRRTAVNAVGLEVEAEKNKDDSSLDLRICSWAKVPTEVDPCVEHFIVICDEAHSMQSMTAARTQSVLQLVKDKRCVGVLMLTGTPMKNGKPSNLFPLLKAVRHPFGRHQKAYEAHFCEGGERNFGRGTVWSANGASNLDQLKRLVKSHLLHLTKEESLPELPPMTREMHQVPVCSRSQAAYIRCVKDVANIQAQPKTADNGEAFLGAVQRLRVTCSFAKIDATVETAKRVLETEPALVIFTNFAQVAKQIHQKLSESGWKGELLTGETPKGKRQGMVDSFQEGLSPVFVCTFGAGGVGLTLTAANTIIFLDRPWTPGEARQAEDRVRRIGQDRPVKSIWMAAFELDHQIDAMLESKLKTSQSVLQKGRSGPGAVNEFAKIDIPKLMNSLLAKIG